MSSGPRHLRERRKSLREWLCHNGHITGGLSDDSGSSNTGPVPVCSHVERKTKQRSVESIGQVKHGNISFLLTQGFGSHLCEVALIFRRETPSVRFTHVEYWKKKKLPGDEPRVKPNEREGSLTLYSVCVIVSLLTHFNLASCVWQKEIPRAVKV